MKVRKFSGSVAVLVIFSVVIVSKASENFNETYDYGNRTGKFLFDALFGLEAAFSDAEETVSPNNLVKSCDCG